MYVHIICMYVRWWVRIWHRNPLRPAAGWNLYEDLQYVCTFLIVLPDVMHIFFVGRGQFNLDHRGISIRATTMDLLKNLPYAGSFRIMLPYGDLHFDFGLFQNH